MPAQDDQGDPLMAQTDQDHQVRPAEAPTWTPEYLAAKEAERQFLERLRQPVYVNDGFDSGYEPDPYRVDAAARIERLRIDYETQTTLLNAWQKRAMEAESAALRGLSPSQAQDDQAQGTGSQDTVVL